MEEMENFFNEMLKEEEIKKTKLPTALKIQKHKLLCALGKAQPSPTEEEDEKFVKEMDDNTFGFFMNFLKSYRSLHWSDTIAINSVKLILEEHQHFDISLYIDCAKAIYLTYSGKVQHTGAVYGAFTYVLTHARLFGDPAQSMFQLESNGSFKIEFGDISKQLPDSTYMRKITGLIEDLRIGYNEMKFRILNANVTYLTLLILRRFVKNETQFFDMFKRVNTHDDYVKLCPHPLDSQLPRITQEFNKNLSVRSLCPAVYLAIHAFLNGNDTKTNRILRATCIQYIEWTGLQLPYLFFKVVDLYAVEESNLWESLQYESTYQSLFKLANDYYKQYKNSKADPPETVAWFPYCRALDGDYHADLSGPQNKDLCMILAYLVDLKIGFDKSYVRNAHWTKKNFRKDFCLDAAKKISENMQCT
ncbi:Uncharacterized protein OBRU01_13078 [Operophtera brumata]|uniref:Uncharacterized protein n=1 Tax=Operophtera brumata TaxID=104452 RepID=A0A0L7L8V7_OPEBR|nr:Uncharacterized protein OBRU01_13078 [Operophtera brumata]